MTSNDPFDGPGAGSGSLDLEALKGSLLLFTPRAVENVSTSFGPKDAIRGDVVAVDGPAKGEQLADVLVFPSVLVSQLREAAGTGRMVLGRLTQGNAKPGQKPPWRLDDPTEQDKTAGRAWLAANGPAPY